MHKEKKDDFIQNLFGSYEDLNFAKINQYTKQLQDQIKAQQNFNGLYFTGDDKINFYNFLKNKTLNLQPEPVESTFADLALLVQNLPNWLNPGTMINVIPPVNLAALVASNTIRGLNSNFAQDTYAGALITSELEVSKYISDLIKWNWTQSIGVFTFGGKGTNLYATKIALSKCDYDSSEHGCALGKYFILTSKTAHPCHYEVCNWLGLGRECCIEIPCSKDGRIDLLAMERIIHAELEKGKIFLGCNLNGGSTNELYIDPVKKVSEVIQKIVSQYRLAYRPHIHIDSVIGWVFLFFNDYNFSKNPLQISDQSLKKIQAANHAARDFKYADSVGIDFHKTGFCPYISSLFLCKNRDDYFSMSPNHSQEMTDMIYGNYNPYHTTLELTRPSTGAISALCSLKTMGVIGFQKVYAQMIEAADYFRAELAKNHSIEILNSDSCWMASLFILKPPKYSEFELEDILKLSAEEREKIKQFNIDYAKFIQRRARESQCNFIFTSSRSHVIEGTNVSLGTLKAYPMSVFFNKQIAKQIAHEIDESIKLFSSSHEHQLGEVSSISDDMVYRKDHHGN